MREPSEEFVGFFFKQIYSGVMHQAAKQKLAYRTKEAFNQLINIEVYAGLNSSIANEGEPTPDPEIMTPSPMEEIVAEEPGGVVTITSEELEDFSTSLKPKRRRSTGLLSGTQ